MSTGERTTGTLETVFRFCADVNRWVARQVGLHWIDVLLWRRRAVQDRELAEACEAAGLPDQAAKMRRSAARCQELADEVAAWPRWAWFA